MDPDSKRLRVTVTDGGGRAVRDGGLARWLESVAPARARGEVALAIASDSHVRELNRRYRRHDRPTDVLAFPAGSDHSGPEPGLLGDIVIARGVARRQASEAGHSYQAELRVLALHGLLHLLGYDHHDSVARTRMGRLESRLLRKGGLRRSLIKRSSNRTAARRSKP